jgi:glycosyltransferase involved in cell wall biosynthesis
LSKLGTFLTFLRGPEAKPAARPPAPSAGREAVPLRQDFGAEAAARKPLDFYFDVSDLIVYFSANRTPTGIQRIVLAVAEAALSGAPLGRVRLCALDPASYVWKAVDKSFIQRLTTLSHEGTQRSDPQWGAVFAALSKAVAEAPRHEFPRDSVLVNLGSPWHMGDYFRAIEGLKRDFGVIYVAYVHDAIPILYPEYCSGVVPGQYLNWLYNLTCYADLILANSENTKRDVLKTLALFGSSPVRCEVVSPNGDFTSLFKETGQLLSPEIETLLTKRYVLFVSTVEPRKNHLMVASAWHQLTKELGAARMPRLVLVGKPGWSSQPLFEFIRKTESLDGNLAMLNEVSDADLQALYRNAAFTVYNSRYEGWGLPVTESLSYGKVPVIAQNSGLIEAGGSAAVFFETNSEPSLAETLRSVVLNPRILTEREAAIRANPPVRSWRQIYEHIYALSGRALDARRGREVKAPDRTVALGRLYRFGLDRLHSMRLGEGTFEAAEFPAFKFGERARHDNDCFPAEPWGIWTKRPDFRIGFDLPAEPVDPRRPAPAEPLLLFLRVRGHFQAATVRIRINGLPAEIFSVPLRVDSLLRMRIPGEALAPGRLSLLASQEPLCDLSQILSDDNRTIGIGLRYFMLCRERDAESRVKFMEYALLGDPDELYLPGRAAAESAAAQLEGLDVPALETAEAPSAGEPDETMTGVA